METLEIVRQRLARQHLSTPPLASPADVVGFLGAVQAQEYPEAKWSLSQRSGDPPDSEVEAAIERGEVLRTHIMRPTWHCRPTRRHSLDAATDRAAGTSR